jgi:hypothetical protein
VLCEARPGQNRSRRSKLVQRVSREHVLHDDRSVSLRGDPADRAKVVPNISGGTDSPSFGTGSTASATAVDPLDESATASIQLTTQAGGETAVTITVSNSLTGTDAVEL